MYAEAMSNVSYTETFLDFEGADSFWVINLSEQ